jgi:diacylglycerol kinase (ATP)
MKNKRHFSILANIGHAFNGIREVLRNETAFKIELFFFVVLQIVVFAVPIQYAYKAVLSVSLFIPLIAELINSAVERTVDLVTDEYRDLAKRAKDAASAAVLVSITATCVLWLWVIFLLCLRY